MRPGGSTAGGVTRKVRPPAPDYGRQETKNGSKAGETIGDRAIAAQTG